MNETQASIGQWREDTFGPIIGHALDGRVADEMKEMGEALIAHLSDAAPDYTVMEEMADVLITMFAWAEHHGLDLLEHVDKKMAINRARKWRRHGDGTGQHIKEGE